jgi:inner membrane protein
LDNVTHTLIGLIAGESFSHATSGTQGSLDAGRRRTLYVVLGTVGGNLPDLDLLYSYGGGAADPLRYVLEHRGYTHTIFGCTVLGLLLYAAAVGYTRWRKYALGARDQWLLAAMASLSVALHLAMDSLNSYGVHPFWPFQDHWSYGDAVFIVEPLYWVAAAPLIFALRSMTARVLLGVILAAGLVLGLVSGWVAPLACATLGLLLVCLLAVGWKCRTRVAAIVSAAAFVLVTLSFVLAGRVATSTIVHWAQSDFPQARLFDHILSPMPANPLCWNAMILQLENQQYVARQAVVSLAPRFIPAAGCRSQTIDQLSATFPTAPTERSSSVIRWRTFSMSRESLVSVLTGSCHAMEFAQFARAPYIRETSQGPVLGDLRFEPGRGGLSALELPLRRTATSACVAEPPWVPPRSDLLPDR